jgi:hypothetical protein
MTNNAISSTTTSYVVGSSSSILRMNRSLQNISHLVSIKLDHLNYLLWHSQLLPILRGQDLLKYVNGECPYLIYERTANSTTL